MAQYTQINPDALVTALTPINNSLGGKQDKTDNTLTTTDKTISGAINEINTKVSNLTGALTWKGKFDTLPAVTDYEAGNVVGVGNKEYVLTVTGSTKAWEELGDEGSYLLKSVAEETYLKKADGAVTTANIADGAVTKEKLANASVTYEKVSNDVQTKLDNNVKIVDQVLTAAEQKQVRKNIAIPNYETFDDITKLSSLTAERLLYIGPDNVNVTVPVSVNTSTLEVDFQGRKINFSGYNSEQIAFKGHSKCKLKNLIFKLVDVSYKKDANICISKFGYVENIALYCTVGDQTVGFKENHTLGFLSCDHLYNCKVYGGGVLGEPGIAIGYKYCNYLNMCRYSGSEELPGLIGFSHCNFISQCYSTHSNRDHEEAYGIGTNSNVDSLIWIGGDGGEFTTYSDIDHAIIGGYDTTNMFNTISSNGGTGKTKLYAKPDDKSGMATVLLDTTPVNWAVARRTATGTLKAKDATEDDDLVTKKQLDAAEETYAKKTDIPTIPAIPTVNDPKVSIKMNGAEKGSFTLNQASAGEVDLGTVLTEHQDISGKVDKTTLLNTLMVVDLSSDDIAVRKAALDDFKAKWLALGNTDLNGARFIAKGYFNLPSPPENNVIMTYVENGLVDTGYIGIAITTYNSILGVYRVNIALDGTMSYNAIKDQETTDAFMHFAWGEVPTTYLKITDAESTYETKTHAAETLTETLRDYAKSEEIPIMGNMATANAITSIKHDLSLVLKEIDLSGTDADRKAKLDQFAADWKALTGASNLVGSRFVGRFNINDYNSVGLFNYNQDLNYEGISCSDTLGDNICKVAVNPDDGSLTITPLFSHLEAITLKTSNTTEAMNANKAAIQAYVNNLNMLGVDVTKGFNVPVRTDNNFCGCLTGEYFGVDKVGFLSGSIFSVIGGAYYIKDIYINPMGRYDELVNIMDDNILNTTSKDLIGAINEVNTLAKSKGNGTITGVKMNGVSKGTSGVVDLGTVITAHQDISGKQDKLVSGMNIKTINGESVLGSGDITITSSGGAYPEVNHGTGDTTFTLTPNTFHVWDEVTSLTLNFGSGISGMANEYLFQFTSGPTATSLALPDDIKWANDNVPTIEANMIYQVSILHGLASVLEFNNAKVFPIIGPNGGYPNEEYAKVYEYFVSTYNLISSSSDPSNGVIITETLICNDANYGGPVLKVSLSETMLLLWTQKAINGVTVPTINNLGVYYNYMWD